MQRDSELVLLRHENRELKYQARQAHDRLMMACAELGKPSDGHLLTAVRRAVEMIYRLSNAGATTVATGTEAACPRCASTSQDEARNDSGPAAARAA